MLSRGLLLMLLKSSPNKGYRVDHLHAYKMVNSWAKVARPGEQIDG